MAFITLVAFDRPLADVAAPGQRGRTVTEAEWAAQAETAYRRGVDATRALADQQMVDVRADVERLSDGVLKHLGEIEGALVAQLREALPSLAIDIARRLLAEYEPPADVVARLCEQALGELFPEQENLELCVSARDAELLEHLRPSWTQRYPGLRVRIDAGLGPGDCQVRSRFGLTDARQQTKLGALAQTLGAVER